MRKITPNATTENLNALYRDFNNGMMDSAEVGSLESDYTASAVAEIEQAEGCRFTMQQIVRTWCRAADDMVDSYIENENDTPQTDEERRERIARWSAMRPSAGRRTAILKALAAAAK